MSSLVTIAAASIASLGQLHSGDVVLTIQNSALATNAVATPPSGLAPQRVFVVDLQDFGTAWFANDPGFDSFSGTFTPGFRLGPAIQGSLRRWNGQDFHTIATSQRTRMALGGQQRFTPVPPASDSAQPPIFASSGSTGQFHVHFGMTLQAWPDLSQAPDDGLYLLLVRLVSESGALAPSSTIGLVLEKNASPEQVTLASQWASTWLAAGQPGPTPPCLPDVAGANQSSVPDGVLTADDIIVFLAWYFASDTRADIAGANQATTPDSQFTADDIIVYLSRYFAGCN
ncbi:MAG: hypothetical protein MUE97_03475 [Phycisphaerales bacterium]|jgi:hypothetical protein|nr:hypothetical protein [Phycisphaerales bacterium]